MPVWILRIQCEGTANQGAEMTVSRVRIVSFVVLVIACSASERTGGSAEVGSNDVPSGELYRIDDEQSILRAARAIIAADSVAALVTIDADGQPRVRSVNASTPEQDMTIWIATRPDTRKVEQIRRNPNVALYYNDDEALSYVSIMGIATLHDDLATKDAKNFFDDSVLRALWPDYPRDYLLIRVTPRWIEVIGHGISAHPQTWRPQAVEIAR